MNARFHEVNQTDFVAEKGWNNELDNWDKRAWNRKDGTENECEEAVHGKDVQGIVVEGASVLPKLCNEGDEECAKMLIRLCPDDIFNILKC